jgi:sporulation protein YqfC
MRKAGGKPRKEKKPGGIMSLGERLARMFELPPDMLGNKPKVTAVGRGEVLVENYKGIMDFEDGVVRINTGNGVIKVSGTGITIREITSEAVIIGGKITNIDYDA